MRLFMMVKSPTNDFGPDYLIASLDESFIEKVEKLAAVVKDLDVYSITEFSYVPDWYTMGDDFYFEIEGRVGDKQYLRLTEDEYQALITDPGTEKASVDVPELVVTREGIQWQSESPGGDVYFTPAMPTVSELREMLAEAEAR